MSIVHDTEPDGKNHRRGLTAEYLRCRQQPDGSWLYHDPRDIEFEEIEVETEDGRQSFELAEYQIPTEFRTLDDVGRYFHERGEWDRDCPRLKALYLEHKSRDFVALLPETHHGVDYTLGARNTEGRNRTARKITKRPGEQGGGFDWGWEAASADQQTFYIPASRNPGWKDDDAWGTLAEANAAFNRCLNPDKTLSPRVTPEASVFDIDAARNPVTGEVSPWANHLLNIVARAGFKVFLSSSGTGFHCFTTGVWPIPTNCRTFKLDPVLVGPELWGTPPTNAKGEYKKPGVDILRGRYEGEELVSGVCFLTGNEHELPTPTAPPLTPDEALSLLWEWVDAHRERPTQTPVLRLPSLVATPHHKPEARDRADAFSTWLNTCHPRPHTDGANGDQTTWDACGVATNGFLLTPEEALPLILDSKWNAEALDKSGNPCPRSEAEIERRLNDSVKSYSRGGKPLGWMINECMIGEELADFRHAAYDYIRELDFPIRSQAGVIYRYDEEQDRYVQWAKDDFTDHFNNWLGLRDGKDPTARREGLVGNAVLVAVKQEWDTITGETDNRPYLKFTGGLLDLDAALRGENPTLIPSGGDYFSRRPPLGEWDPDATAPTFAKIVADVCRTPEGERRLDRENCLLQLLAGILHQSLYRQRALVIHGPAHCGKSALLAAVKALLGDLSTPGGIEQLKGYSAVSPEDFKSKELIVDMMGAGANIVEEFDELMRVSASRYKAVITSNAIQVRYLFKAPFPYSFRVPQIYATNELPRWSEKSEAIFRRNVYMHAEYVITPDERIPGLDDPRTWYDNGELPGVVNMLLKAAREMPVDAEAHGLRPNDIYIPEELVRETREKIQEGDHALDFVQTCLEPHEGGMVKSSDVTKRYQDFVAEEYGNTFKPNQSAAKKYIKKLYPEAKWTDNSPLTPGARSRYRGWLNLRFRSPEDVEQE